MRYPLSEQRAIHLFSCADLRAAAVAPAQESARGKEGGAEEPAKRWGGWGAVALTSHLDRSVVSGSRRVSGVSRKGSIRYSSQERRDDWRKVN